LTLLEKFEVSYTLRTRNDDIFVEIGLQKPQDIESGDDVVGIKDRYYAS
jgi:hypothetical protein